MFLFNESCYEDKINLRLKKSKPKNASSIIISKVEKDLSLGDFTFFLSFGKHNFKLPFLNSKTENNENLNLFWKFLEEVSFSNSPLLLHLLYAGVEFFICVFPYSKFCVRFCVLNTINLRNKEISGEILRYTAAEADIDMDIIIKKKTLVKTFYEELRKIFIESDAVALFEPPAVNYDYWQKDSSIIKNYLDQ